MINDRVKKQIDIMRGVYISDPNRILSDYRRESAEIQGYHGRELLELLQNAVDELGENTDERIVHISLSNGILKICNNGNPFTFDGFISLMYSNLSPKHNKSEYIGNKGTGFRSILNWSNSVRIYSGDLSVEFSKKYADEMLAELSSEFAVRDFCAKNDTEQDPVRIATLVAPKIIPPIEKDYVTVIEISLQQDVVEDVVEQLIRLEAKTLLFLEKLEKLVLEYDNTVYKYTKSHSADGITIMSYKDDELTDEETWLVKYEYGVFDRKKYHVMIAYKEDMSVEPDVLFSYFKTKVEFPIPVLVHATFDLTADRNYLAETEANKHILKVICDSIVSLSLDIAAEDVSYAPLELLATIDSFPRYLSWGNFSIEHYYLSAISRSKVFPTVNGTYISFEELPKFYDSVNFSDYLCGDCFSTLMPYTESEAIIGLIDEIAELKKVSIKYTYDEITNGINSILSTLTLHQRAELWCLFNRAYGRQVSSAATKPLFAIDSTGKTIIPGQQVFLPPENVHFDSPPNFTKIVFLNKELVTELRKAYYGYSLRYLANELSDFGIREYHLANIVNAVISRLKKREHQSSKNTIGCYEDTVDWLWKLWKTNVLSAEISNISTVPLLNRNGIPTDADKLYLGKEFGNTCTEALFCGNNECFVALPKRVTISESTRDAYIEFLKALGVATYPRIEKIKLSTIPSDYKELIYKSIRRYPLIVDDNNYQNEYAFRNASFSSVTVSIVDRIEEILTKADTTSIFSWIKQDFVIQQYLDLYEPSDSFGYIKNYSQLNYRKIKGDNLASYIRHIFSTHKWVEVDGVRYAPSQCLFVPKLGMQLAPLVIYPDLEIYVDNPHHKTKETDEIRRILEMTGAATEYTELDINTFYSLLLKLPEVDANGELSKALYTAVVKSDGLRDFNANNSLYKRFLQEGQVFCKSSKTYVNISDVKYLTEKTVSREILKGFNLIAIPSRQSKEKIKQYLGVESLKIKGSVIGEPVLHPLNDVFEKDFLDFICYAFCFRADVAKSSEISTVKGLKVRLCTKISADYGSGEILLAENSYIRGKNYVYIQAPASCDGIDKLKGDVEFCSAIAELFMTAIDIQDDTLFGYVRSLYEKSSVNRNALIVHDFDDLSVLEQSRELLHRTQTEKEMFIAACELIVGTKKASEIIDLINGINFNDFRSLQNTPLIISILKSMNVNVADFNDKSEIFIDLRPYYLSLLTKLHEEKKAEYKNALFAGLVLAGITQQRSFLKQYEKYTKYSFAGIPQNSITYDYEQEFFSKFGEPLEHTADMNADESWTENRILFVEGKDPNIVAEILSSLELDSLLYFGAFDELEAAYAEKVAEYTAAEQREEEIYTTESPSDAVVVSVMSTTPIETSNSLTPYQPHTGSRTTGTHRERNISDQGAFAEKVVYEQLHKLHSEVCWVSENAKKAGVNPDGIAGLGYDITYRDADGDIVYVEVKSTVDPNIQFKMSEGELLFAEMHPRAYEVIVVTSVLVAESRTVNRLPKSLFDYTPGETRFSNSRFSITSDSYTIRCQASGESEDVTS